MFLKRHEPWLINTCFGRAKKVSKRRRAFLNWKRTLWRQKKMYGEKNLHKKELLGEKSNSSHIWPCPKLLQSLLVSHLLIDFYIRICDLLFLEFTIWLQILLAVSDKCCSSLLSCWPCRENNTERGSEWRRRTWKLKEKNHTQTKATNINRMCWYVFHP